MFKNFTDMCALLHHSTFKDFGSQIISHGFTKILKVELNCEQSWATRKSKARKRKITWYIPPWDGNVKTNLGLKFLLIVDKCFPKNHPLNKIFNRHTLKVSSVFVHAKHHRIIRSCLPRRALRLHPRNNHASVTAEISQNAEWKCMQENVAYQATVATETTTENYVGLASNFKEQRRNHQTSFQHHSKRNETDLSKHIDLESQRPKGVVSR